MNVIKNKLFILILFITFVFPLGGIGISGIGNMHAIDPDNEIEGPVTLTLESQNWEGGFNWFLYFDNIDIRRHLIDVEEVLIKAAIEKNDGHITKAAEILKLNRTTLIEKMKKLSINQ